MQRLAQDATEVAELQDKVTRAWVATIMVVALAARAERMCHTPFRERGNEASIRVPRMFKSHVQ
jgi:hypothetical protein